MWMTWLAELQADPVEDDPVLMETGT